MENRTRANRRAVFFVSFDTDKKLKRVGVAILPALVIWDFNVIKHEAACSYRKTEVGVPVQLFIFPESIRLLL